MTVGTAAQSRVDAIIVNWNGRSYLDTCIAAVRASTVRVSIVVVDNASTDGSVEHVAQWHPDVRVLALAENVGYAAGANAGLHATAAEYACILNSDVHVAPDHFERLTARLDEDRTIGAAQGKLYQVTPDAFLGQDFPRGGRLDSAGHLIRRTRMVVDRGQGEPDGPEYDIEASVFSACGAALFLRRSMLEELAPDGEYFDAAFFAYKEDIDLCWRARLLGWDIRYVPDAVAHHARGWPGGGLPDRSRVPLAARRHSWKNHYLLMLKNDRAGDMVRSLPWIIGWEIARQGYALLRDPALYTSYRELLPLLAAALRSRREGAAQTGRVREWFGADVKPTAAPRCARAPAGATAP
jgi:GT2 family glycosyltransferase